MGRNVNLTNLIKRVGFGCLRLGAFWCVSFASFGTLLAMLGVLLASSACLRHPSGYVGVLGGVTAPPARALSRHRFGMDWPGSTLIIGNQMNQDRASLGGSAHMGLG